MDKHRETRPLNRKRARYASKHQSKSNFSEDRNEFLKTRNVASRGGKRTLTSAEE